MRGLVPVCITKSNYSYGKKFLKYGVKTECEKNQGTRIQKQKNVTRTVKRVMVYDVVLEQVDKFVITDVQ